MKRFYIITILAIICSLSAMAQNRPDMAHQTPGRDRDQFKATLSMPYVTLSNNYITVTGISGYWTMWMTDVSANMYMAPESFEGELEHYQISVDVPEDIKYYLFITTSSGNTYKWSVFRGYTNLIVGGEMPSSNTDSLLYLMFPDLLM